jgi:hypothetical protein
MWATEAVPHYVTSLLIPMLVVATGTLLPPKGKDCSLRDKACLAERYKPYPPHEAAKEITGQFFDPTVLLFMAGFRLESRLQKNLQIPAALVAPPSLNFATNDVLNCASIFLYVLFVYILHHLK